MHDNPPVERDGLSRREVLAAGAAAGATLAMGATPTRAAAQGAERRLTFAGDGDGWPGWAAPGVANLKRSGGLGLLEAGSDVFPNDPRPVAFAVDARFRDGEIVADIARTGSGPGVVLRRVGPRAYYAALYATDSGALTIVRRDGARFVELARATAPPRLTEGTLSLRAEGRRLTARLDGTTVTAEDGTPALQQPGDPGVLATAQTLYPSEGPEALPALGNLHLLPYGVQEGQAVMQTAVGQAVLDTIRERSTVALRSITVRTQERPALTLPSAVTTTGAPVTGGAILRVATDVPAGVRIELSTDPQFRRPRRLKSGRTGAHDALLTRATRLPPGRTVHWRARVRRGAAVAVTEPRSFRVPPAPGSAEPVRLAIASCAAQFGGAFDVLAQREPDVFVWQGDLNYADTVGPLAQTVSGYAGIWRDFLANPRMAPLLERACFAVQRDDHDYGLQDANATNLLEHGLGPWEALMEARPFYRFSAGLVDVWVLDQRHFKSDPTLPDTPQKTLLGLPQRTWLLQTLAASTAPFKVICSPCTLAPLPANNRDGSWAAGFTKERDLLLAHIRTKVTGTTLFVTGDTHWAMAYERDGLFEARPCPLGIPAPNDITLTQPNVAEDARRQPGVVYADDEHDHFALIDVKGTRTTATLELSLVREDGETPYRRTFTRRRREGRRQRRTR